MFAGIDIGGMSIKAGIVDENGKLLATYAVETPKSGNEEFLKAAYEAVKGVQEKTGVTKIDAIGIGAPGICDRERAILCYGNNLVCENADFGTYLGEKFNVPVLMENDANCAALGEYYSCDEKPETFVFITLGTGIGSGIIINGKLFIGCNGSGAELGHSVTHKDGRNCTCGRNGCWEAYGSVTGLINLTEENRNKIKSIKDDENIDGRTVFEYAKAGDKEAKRVRDEWIDEVADGVVNVINMFQPDVLLIGGAISKEGDTLMLPIREKVKNCEYTRNLPNIKKTKVMASTIGGNAGIIGAALLWKNKNGR